jgi:hypothetical protein
LWAAIDVYPPKVDFPAGIDLSVADSIARACYRNNRLWRIATNSGYHDSAHPSRIILPVIPAS